MSQGFHSLWMPAAASSSPDMQRETSAVQVPAGAGTANCTARLSRLWDGEPVPALAADYAETEYYLSGTATAYAGPVTGPVVAASEGNRFVTRILVRRPARPERFSGRVVVEPFNTSFGVDRDALWARVGGLLQAQDDVWIGVSVRAMAAAELAKLDSARYAEIDLPVNDFAWDVLRELGIMIKTGGIRSPLRHLAVRRVYLAGYSQSAVDVATFAMAFHATARLPGGAPVYDGYFPAAHAASFAAIASGTAWVPPMEYSPMRDIDVPVIEVQPQSDVEGFSSQTDAVTFVNPGSASVRRADSDFRRGRYRLYELAGAPHAAQLEGCDGPGSRYPTSAFMRAALRLLFRWAEDAIPPPRCRRISMHSDGPVSVARIDRYGNPVGGVRLPHLDVPLARYDAHSTPGPLCELVGRETPLPTESLVARYRNIDTYLIEFAAALDAAIGAGYLLAEDREQIMDDTAFRAREAFAPNEYQETLVT